MQKRISALLLAMVIVIGSVLDGNTLKVKAASATVAMSPELAAEFYMVLLQVAETAMHVSGANNGFNNKEAMEAIGDGVQGYFVTSMSQGVDFEFQTTDGEMLMYGREAQSKTRIASPATIPKSGERNRKIHSCMLYLISI